MDPIQAFDVCARADNPGGRASASPAQGCGERIVQDRLPDSFVLDRSESEWLLTLLTADELRYIFEGPTHGETQD